VNWVKESGVEAYWLDAGWFDGCFPVHTDHCCEFIERSLLFILQ